MLRELRRRSCWNERSLSIFNLAVHNKRSKDSIKAVVKADLSELGVVQPGKLHAVGAVLETAHVSGDAGLTLEQRRELLMLQIGMEKLWREAQVKRIEVEERTQSSCGSGAAQAAFAAPGRSISGSFDVASNLRLVSHFCERDPDTFFSLFERVAESREWSDSDCTSLRQCVLTGRAQEAFSA